MSFAQILASDLAACFREFGVTATYKVGGLGAGSSITVLFDAPNLDTLEISTTNPTVLVRASEVAAPARGDTVTIGAAVYAVSESQPQSDQASFVLQLQK